MQFSFSQFVLTLSSHFRVGHQSDHLLDYNITLCNTLKVNRRFGGIFCLRLQALSVSQARNQLYLLPASCYLLLELFINSEDGGKLFLRKFG
jgi:hypothetical protein